MKRLLIIGSVCCIFYPAWCIAQKNNPSLVDKYANRGTKALYRNLQNLTGKHILFGHQHATEYGHGWQNIDDKSDVQLVTGSHPAVIGADFSGITNTRLPDSVTDKLKESLRKTIAATYNRGGITTVAWHFSNPLSGGGFNWNDSVSVPAVKFLIPGGSSHQQYKNILKIIASFAASVKGNDGQPVPMIFRPYHEFDGNWFWWGKSHCTREEFITLWQFTVGYLRDSLGVHNFIYAFSPDCLFSSEATYLERYPGNEWVDILGMDDYADFGRNGRYDTAAGIQKLKIITALAEKNKKLAAFTETGLESIPDTAWWTGVLLKALKTPSVKLCYVLVWRNDARSATHFYAPFPGQLSVPDFLLFYNDPFTWFEKDLPAMYK